MPKPATLRPIGLTAQMEAGEFCSSATLDLTLPNGRHLRLLVDFMTGKDEEDAEPDDQAEINIRAFRGEKTDPNNLEMINTITVSEPQPTTTPVSPAVGA